MATIRSLTSQDSADLLKWRGGDEYKNAVITAELTEHFKGDRVIFVAVVGPAIVGTVQLAPCHADPDLGDGQVVAHLQALEVRAEFRQQGIGGALVKAVETEATSRGFERLTLVNTSLARNRVSNLLHGKGAGPMIRWRATDLLRGAGYALLADLAFAGLFLLTHSGGLMWAPALVWAMGALAVTGIAIAEARYLIAAGFWLLQLAVFTLFLAGFLKLLSFLPPAPGA